MARFPIGRLAVGRPRGSAPPGPSVVGGLGFFGGGGGQLLGLVALLIRRSWNLIRSGFDRRFRRSN